MVLLAAAMENLGVNLLEVELIYYLAMEIPPR
jgi:hypothetical protein